MYFSLWRLVQAPFGYYAYRQAVKRTVAEQLRSRNMRLTREEAWEMAEAEIRAGRVPALDSLGRLRGPWERFKGRLKADPRTPEQLVLAGLRWYWRMTWRAVLIAFGSVFLLVAVCSWLEDLWHWWN